MLTKLYIDGLKAEIEGTNQRLDQLYSQQKQHHREKVAFALTDQQNRCLRTFKISTYEEQKNINPRKVEGTCLWALQSTEYIRWSESSCNDLLWVSADPGCGKSVLSRSIIEDCLETSRPEVTICYFFFKDNDEQNHLALALCSVLHQLFSQRPQLLRYAIPSWEKNGEKLREEVDELWRIFTTAVLSDEVCKTICIFDALDECREADQNRLIKKLHSFHRLSRPRTQDTWLKLLVTSRPYDDIQNSFRAITDAFPHLHLKGEKENDQIHQEIDLVVKMRVKELAEKAALSRDTEQRLEQQLLQMEHRTYLWLHLALDDIQSTLEDSLRPAEESIEVIPQSVDEAYEKILSRVPSRQVDIARKILQIIVAARRPLTTAEMAMALGIATSPQAQTAAKAGLESPQIERKLRRLCGLFVFINNSKIYLIHQTARDFLIAKANLDHVGFVYSWKPSDPEDQMAHICVRYLLMEDLDNHEHKSCGSIRTFLEYSAVYWPDHVRRMGLPLGKILMNRLLRLYDNNRKRTPLWFPIFWKAVGQSEQTPMINALHLAAFNGHEQAVCSLLALDKGDMNRADSTSTYPIVWASLNGHLDTVQVLLTHGANVNTHGGLYGTALHAASSKGHDDVVRLLLEHGADVNSQDGEQFTPLRAASSQGYDEVVRLLLEHKADVNIQDRDYGTALQTASFGGYVKVVQMLLGFRANLHARDGLYCTALHAASSQGHDEVVRLLLERGADVNAQGGRYGTALHAACSAGYVSVVHILLDLGADSEVRDIFGRTALQVACVQGHDMIVQIFRKVDFISYSKSDDISFKRRKVST